MTVEQEGRAEAPPGIGIVRASWAGTGVFVATTAAATASPDSFGLLAAAVDLVLFAIGCVAFLLAFFRVVERSRTEEIAVVSVYFLSGIPTPPGVRTPLLLSLGVQVVVAIATAALRPYTELAFGVLVPVFGLGLVGLWASRFAEFPPRARK